MDFSSPLVRKRFVNRESTSVRPTPTPWKHDRPREIKFIQVTLIWKACGVALEAHSPESKLERWIDRSREIFWPTESDREAGIAGTRERDDKRKNERRGREACKADRLAVVSEFRLTEGPRETMSVRRASEKR